MCLVHWNGNYSTAHSIVYYLKEYNNSVTIAFWVNKILSPIEARRKWWHSAKNQCDHTRFTNSFVIYLTLSCLFKFPASQVKPHTHTHTHPIHGLQLAVCFSVSNQTETELNSSRRRAGTHRLFLCRAQRKRVPCHCKHHRKHPACQSMAAMIRATFISVSPF